MANPLEQFVIKPIIPIGGEGGDISFTNSALVMMVTVGLCYAMFHFGTSKRSVVPGRVQSLFELAYEFVRGIVVENVGKEGLRYLPVICTIFLFVLIGNMLGMIPGSFTYTSHIIVTFTIALTVMVGITAIGLQRHGLHFFSLFAPSGVPIFVYPILIPIEVISYLIRPISLAVRLAVNMTAGHILLKSFGGFIVAMGAFGVLPFVGAVGLTGLEFVIAFLQAYVFVVLTCLYLNDAIHLH